MTGAAKGQDRRSLDKDRQRRGQAVAQKAKHQGLSRESLVPQVFLVEMPNIHWEFGSEPEETGGNVRMESSVY